MIAEQIAYFRHLATSCVDIRHGVDDKEGFFCHDLKLMLDAKRKSGTIMFLPPFNGNFRDNRSDNPLDEARIQWSILQRMEHQNEAEVERVAKATKDIALKIVARMQWHQNDDPEHTYCKLLEYFDLDDIEYRTEAVYQDDWTGIRVITPLTSSLELTMNPDDWVESVEP